MRRINKLLLSITALGMLGTVSASAADMAVKSPYVEAPRAFSWSGFYLGLHAGYGWGSNEWDFLGVVELPGVTGNPLSPKTNGVLAGVQAGANYQLGTWVFGMEADWALMRGRASASGPVFTGPGNLPITATAMSQIDWLATFTGRLGYAADRSLFYVKAGVAAAEYKDDYSILLVTTPPQMVDFGTKTNTLVNWTVGGGIEHAFAPNWSAKIEYNYVNLGTTSGNFNFTGAAASLTFQQNVEHKLQIVKVGANYRF
jgi:outer membrane immunogenic protein